MIRSSGSVPEYRTSRRPVAAQAALHVGDHGGHGRHLGQVPLRADPDVQQHLRVRGQLRREVGQLTARRGHHLQHVQRRHQAVAGEQEVREDDVARLLAAEREVARDHLLHHVLVAHRAADQIDAALAQRDLEADVAHHRRDDRAVAQPARRLEVPGGQQHDRVAVDDPAADGRRRWRGRRRRRTRCRAGTRARRPRRPAAPGWVEPHARLMFRPSGEQPSSSTSNPELGEAGAAPGARSRRWRSRSRRAAAPRSRAPGRARARVRRGTDPRGPRPASGGALAVRHRPRPVGHLPLDLPLDPLGELLARAREHLDAVVLERVVRGGDDDARVEPPFARQVGDGRRRDDAGARHVAPGRPRPVRELAADPLARLARVAPDEQPVFARGPWQRAHERGAQAADGRRIERRDAGAPAHAVCSEESFWHR